MHMVILLSDRETSGKRWLEKGSMCLQLYKEDTEHTVMPFPPTLIPRLKLRLTLTCMKIYPTYAGTNEFFLVYFSSKLTLHPLLVKDIQKDKFTLGEDIAFLLCKDIDLRAR